jgi:hypothetical protein
MIKVKKDGYILELYTCGYKGENLYVNIYKPKWIFFRTFLLNLCYPWDKDQSLKDYVNSAIQEVEDLYS